MGRRRQLASPVADVDSGWETNSTRSIAGCSTDSALDTDSIHLFADQVDNLFEKRRETRERALGALIGIYRQDVRTDEAMQNETSLISRCVALVRRGGAGEATLACHLLGLHVVTLANHQDSHLLEAKTALMSASKCGDSAEARVAAVDTLAISTLICCNDDSVAEEVGDHLQSLWSAGVGNKVVAAAIRGWSLIFTSPSFALNASRLGNVFARLGRLLQSSDMEVRAAAGEALCLLYHCTRTGRDLLRQLAEEDDGDFRQAEQTSSDEDNIATRHPCSSSSSHEEPPQTAVVNHVTMQVVDRMRELSVSQHTGGRKKISKNERKANKSTFSGLLSSLERGAPPTTRVKLQHGDALVVNTWEGHTQLNAVRAYLAGGFQAHLQRNPLFHDMFGYTPKVEAPDRMTATEKRMFRSPNSADAKWRTHERKGGRANKTARQTTLHEDED